jgi:hypothetical protein
MDHHYTLVLRAQSAQILVDALRRLPHYAVDEELKSISRQLDKQDADRREQAIEDARNLVATADRVHPRHPPFSAG